ncbi:MAG: binding-protein-dependent transport system inner rane component [Anaerocolumna sp.]|jgi:peptide/nickel transport system permease protein|nr:binding-protein-dependent transport system inner rane component [Anaerocolumna sp.]
MDELQLRNEQEQDEFEQSQVIMTPGQLVVKRFFRNKLAGFGMGIIILMILFCFIGPFFSPYGEYEIFYINKSTGEEINMKDERISQKGVTINIKAPISKSHWLGTDGDGRDVLTRLMYGGRISLTVGICVVIVELIIGVTLGGIAGHYGGKVDMIIMRLVEIFYCIPFIPLMLIISAIMVGYGISPRHKIYFIMLVLGVISWAGVARMVRGQILSLREMEFMQAAEATGIRVSKQIFKHLVPNVMPIIIILATMDLGGIILTESVLSYLGVGISFPYASWGNMVNAVTNSIILKNYFNIWMPPGICILLTVLAFNFIGDGLRDAFDPKMKR